MAATFSESARVLWPEGGERLVCAGDEVWAGQVLAVVEAAGVVTPYVAPFAGVIANAGDGYAVVYRTGDFPAHAKIG